MKQIVVHKGRTARLRVSVGMDVSGDSFFSEVREEVDPTSTLLASWTVEMLTDGTDGELLLTMTDVVSGAVQDNVGYMDIKRVSDGDSFDVLGEPLQVKFEETITA